MPQYRREPDHRQYRGLLIVHLWSPSLSQSHLLGHPGRPQSSQMNDNHRSDCFQVPTWVTCPTLAGYDGPQHQDPLPRLSLKQWMALAEAGTETETFQLHKGHPAARDSCGGVSQAPLPLKSVALRHVVLKCPRARYCNVLAAKIC